jgi:predicted aspartyl protease
VRLQRLPRGNVSDVGILRVTIGVESHLRRGDVRELPDTMVDTGSEYTWVPRVVLESLSIGVERVTRFVTADGRVIAREMGYAIVHAGGARTSDEVVFAESGDMVLLGAHTIEGMNLRVDLREKRLVPGGPVPAAVGRTRHCRMKASTSATKRAGWSI